MCSKKIVLVLILLTNSQAMEIVNSSKPVDADGQEIIANQNGILRLPDELIYHMLYFFISNCSHGAEIGKALSNFSVICKKFNNLVFVNHAHSIKVKELIEEIMQKVHGSLKMMYMENDQSLSSLPKLKYSTNKSLRQILFSLTKLQMGCVSSLKRKSRYITIYLADQPYFQILRSDLTPVSK